MPASRVPLRSRRWLWICLGGAMGLGLGLVMLLLPPVQNWLLRKLVATQPGWSLEAEHIGIHPLGLDANGLRFSMPGLTASTEPVTVRIAPSRFLRRELHIEQADLRHVNLEITPAEMEASDAPFLGVIGELTAALPLRWSLAQARVESRVNLLDDGEPIVSGDLTLQGGGVASGKPGEFYYTLAAASILLPPGEHHRIHSSGTLSLQQDDSQTLRRIVLDGDLRLPTYGPLQLPAGHLHAEIAATAAGEAYTVAITIGNDTRLTFHGAFDEAGQGLTGRIELASEGAPLHAHLPAGVMLPRLRATGNAEVDFNVASGAGTADFTFDLAALDWAQVSSSLASLPSLLAHLHGRIELNPSDDARLQHAAVTIAAEGSAPWLVLQTAGPMELAPPTPGAKLAELSIHALPLAWLNGLLEPNAAITAGQLNGRWDLATDDRRHLVLEPQRPLVAEHVQLVLPDAPTLPEIEAQLALHVDLDPEALTAETRAELRLLAPSLWPYVTHVAFAAHHNEATSTINQLTLGVHAADAAPALELALLSPVTLDHTTATARFATGDTARLLVDGLQLDWLTPWLPADTAVAGAWMTGDTIIRVIADGTAVDFESPKPWRFSQLQVAADTTQRILDLALTPSGRIDADTVAGQLRIDSLVTDAGESLRGTMAGSWNHFEMKLDATADLEVRAAMPESLSAAGESLEASLGLHLATLQGDIQLVDRFELSVRSTEHDWLQVRAPEGLLALRKPNGEVILAGQSALEVQLATLPLDWLKPWLPPETHVSGTLIAGEYLLFLEPQKMMLRARTPVQVQDLTLAGPGLPTVENLSARTHLSLDAVMYHQFEPEFSLGIEGTIYATGAELLRGETRVGELDLGLGFMANHSTALARSISSQGYVEFAPLADLGLPTSGLLNFRLFGDLLGQDPLDATVRVEELPGDTPAVEVAAHGKVDADQALLQGDFTVRVLGERPSDVAFTAGLSLDDGLLRFDSSLHSDYFDLDDALKVLTLLEQTESTPVETPDGAPADVVEATSAVPFWSVLRGDFDLHLAEVVSAPYVVRDLGGRLHMAENRLTFDGLRGEMFAGRWSGDFSLDFDATQTAAPYTGIGAFGIHQFETARAVQTVFPNEFGSFDARIDLQAALQMQGKGLLGLLDHAQASFTVEGHDGTLRLTHPDAGTAATLLVLGGAVSFSPELRALGRLLRKFSEMPVKDLRVEGERRADGSLHLNEVLIQSPQMRLRGAGLVPADDNTPLMGRPLQVSFDVAARDETAVILGRMKLLQKQPDAAGYQAMTAPIEVGGEVGKPDPSPLYDLFARAVSGSRGTWGFIMRKVQSEVEKQRVRDAREVAP